MDNCWVALIGVWVLLGIVIVSFLLPSPRRNDGGIGEGMVCKGGLNPMPKTPPPPPPVGQGGKSVRWRGER